MVAGSAARRNVSRALLVYAALAVLVTWPLAVVVLLRLGAPGFAIALFGTGLQGPLLVGYAFARPARRQWWRWLVLSAGGVAILMFALVDGVDLDLHGFLELLILGTVGPAIGHTMATTIVGPLIFGRFLCGWGCWRAMVLERLPVGNGSGRRQGVWTWTPLVGVAITLAAAALLALVLDGARPGDAHGPLAGSSSRVAVGVAVYYAAAITLALALHDRRAFCKYLCPAGFILRWTSRRARLHVSGRAEACDGCDACTTVCPMDIPVAARVQAGARIGAGDCILCQRCVESCPTGALATTFGRN